MKLAVCKARLGNAEELAAIQRLDAQARLRERSASGPAVAALIVEEGARSHDCGGRSVFGLVPTPGRSGRGVGRVRDPF
ncbi:MAG TPA: hypothetical protein VME47_18845 [Acetobacteraceae bacterium]|nr:hypothetical protein [Acetobacteraceae bacterium]